MLPAVLRYTDLPPARAVATSLTVIALLPATGAAAAALQGMSLPTAAPFAAGSLAGMLAGGELAMHMPGPQQQNAFAALTVLAAPARSARSCSDATINVALSGERHASEPHPAV